MRPRYLDRFGIDDRLLAVWLLVVCVYGCQIPVPPSPSPMPDPVVIVPVKSGFRVLIVEERNDRAQLPANQVAIFTSGPFRQWLNSQKIEYRNEDKDADPSHLKPEWQALFAMKRESVPWLIVSGKTTYSGPLPKTVEETQALIESHRP